MKVRKKRKSTDAKQARLQLMSETVRQEVDHMTMFIHMLAHNFSLRGDIQIHIYFSGLQC